MYSFLVVAVTSDVIITMLRSLSLHSNKYGTKKNGNNEEKEEKIKIAAQSFGYVHVRSISCMKLYVCALVFV